MIPESGHEDTGGDSGWSVTVQHRQSQILGDGWNKLALQYGEGPGTGLEQHRAADQYHGRQTLARRRRIYAQLTPKLGGMLTAVVQKDESPSGDLTWTSLGGRLTYGLTEHWKLQGELGHDRVKPGRGETRNLSKLTLAPTFAMAPGFWSRPRTSLLLYLRPLERGGGAGRQRLGQFRRRLDRIDRHLRERQSGLDHRPAVRRLVVS
jgi:maltoporin